MKYTLTIFLITVVVNMKLVHAQTTDEFWAEEFLAEVFLGHLTPKNPKMYLNKHTDFIFMPEVPISTDFCKNFNICDSVEISAIIDGIREFCDSKDSSYSFSDWNEHAPIFRHAKYKKLIFVGDEDWYKLSRKKRKISYHINIMSKPLFTKNGEYAIINRRNYPSAVKYNWWSAIKYNIRNRQNIFKIFTPVYEGGDLPVPNDILLYKRINGKWVCVGIKSVYPTILE